LSRRLQRIPPKKYPKIEYSFKKFKCKLLGALRTFKKKKGEKESKSPINGTISREAQHAVIIK
jgi:hypothetical protein